MTSIATHSALWNYCWGAAHSASHLAHFSCLVLLLGANLSTQPSTRLLQHLLSLS
jgi:hypothetical protein